MTAQTAGVVAPLSVIAAANVRAEAARRGMSQADLARRLGVSRMAMSDRYRGRTPWTLDELETVAGIFGITVSSLVARPEGFEPPTFWLVAGEQGSDAQLALAGADSVPPWVR